MSTIDQTTPAPARRKGPNPLLLAGLGVGAAALIGGGAYAATQVLGGGGDQPADVLPASSAAYLRLDVDPGAGQKIAAVRFFRGLDPETQAKLDKGDWKKWAWEELSKKDGAPAGLDYDKDIAPWLGDRVGMSVVPQGDKEPLVAMALQVKDEGAAKSALDRLKADAAKDGSETFDYYFKGDYVLMTQSSMLATLKAEVEKGPLIGDEEFTGDMSALGDEGIASAWVDNAAAAKMSQDVAQTGDMAGATSGLSANMLGLPDTLAKDAGRSAFTARLQPDSIEVHGITRDGAKLDLGQGESPRLVTDLPADTTVAVSLEHGAKALGSTWDYYASLLPEETKKVQEEASAQGFTLPGDLQTLVGDSMVLSVGPGVVEKVEALSSGTSSTLDVPVAYRTSTDVAKVQTLLGQMTKLAGGGSELDQMLQRRTDGQVFSLGLSQSYLDAVAGKPAQTLGSAPSFTAAVPDAGKASSIFYVDANAYEKYYLPEVTDAQARKALEQLRAVGLSSTVTAPGEAEFTLRFVADE